MRKLLLALALLPAAAFAEDAASELEMFGSPELVTQAASTEPAPAEKKSVGFSGAVTSVMEDVVYSSSDSLNTYILGSLLLDARLKNGVKAFASLETSYYPKTRQTTSTLRELFVDFNIADRVYFRTGKQVLQWGRCYLWNPTDLVNVEKIPFVPKVGSREGAYGLKLHVPFGTKYNIYGFADTGSAGTGGELAGALKLELLAGRTEMAFSGWTKKDRSPVFGYDVSSRLGSVDIAGEVSAAGRDNGRYIRNNNGTLETFRKETQWPLKAAVNFSRGFRVGNFNDRLRVTSEFFYNQTGYVKTPFRDKGLYAYSGPLAAVLPAGTKGLYLLGSGLYDSNYLGRHYGALFTSVSRFLITDLTLNMNYIHNFNDSTGALSAGLNYKNLNDFSAGCLLLAPLGPADGEYTFSGAKLFAQLTAGVSF
ncbi:MAG: hypothetical protein A2X32_07455 [Elusimicrobia bacterium GWC2_64_44]|nr:MAG: hypothetical protein A2X32_07455 [Elusimicrobia bacterium GWC2_64_44]